ncbi:hypothetical protein L207DRAFT_27898 [Hyaloscypha variabilis F]|uniref:Secreted protein n=1 Tax=Hyaloscypha variabilis (strain UAMH 11265 / GT02V1 / F) TaxID=1149755 RepID=A0A2J6RMP6_HYAVF|nr:hypothetical protein L207DRAFT_27898 [Hyaloscypha variabilis F]
MVLVLVVVGMLVKLQAVGVSVDVDVDLDRWRLDIVRGRRHTRPGQSKNSAKVCDTARCRVAVQCCAMLCGAVPTLGLQWSKQSSDGKRKIGPVLVLVLVLVCAGCRPHIPVLARKRGYLGALRHHWSICQAMPCAPLLPR